jgi:DNA primase small subunit
MNANEIVLQWFRKYYENAEFDIPSIEQREFGIGNRKKIDSRHLNFSGTAEFRSYLVSNTPLFVSFSTGYYRYPGATPMQKKAWMGADLVFDLDIHAEGKYGAYALLNQVKSDAIRLTDLLKDDFGISGKDIHVNFSGNRGYHIHVRDRSYLGIGSDERKEIVDYVMGIGLDYRAFFEPDAKRPNDRIERGPRPDESGYRGRFSRAVIAELEGNPKSISRSFAKEDARKRLIDGIKSGNWNSQPFKVNDFLGRLAPIAAKLGLSSVNTDAGVTQDLSKLIRVPESVHGDTGLIAKKISDIDKFEPFRDAMIEATGARESLKVKFFEDVPVLALAGESLGPFKKDEQKELEKPVALFYVLKGSAEIRE